MSSHNKITTVTTCDFETEPDPDAMRLTMVHESDSHMSHGRDCSLDIIRSESTQTISSTTPVPSSLLDSEGVIPPALSNASSALLTSEIVNRNHEIQRMKLFGRLRQTIVSNTPMEVRRIAIVLMQCAPGISSSSVESNAQKMARRIPKKDGAAERK